jgi:hypothetical protein
LTTIYLAPEARDLSMAYTLTKVEHQATAMDKKGTVLTTATSNKVAQVTKTHFANHVEIDSFAYKDQNLSVGDVPVFGNIHDVGRITLLATAASDQKIHFK